jgi:hypothetical protein
VRLSQGAVQLGLRQLGPGNLRRSLHDRVKRQLTPREEPARNAGPPICTAVDRAYPRSDPLDPLRHPSQLESAQSEIGQR